MRRVRVLGPFFLATALVLSTAAIAQAQWWSVQTSGIDTNLRGVSAAYFSTRAGEVPRPAVWVSGSNGVILRSDDGKTWKRLHVKDGDALDFRGVAAVDANVAYVMSIGNGEKSRIYKTVDGGGTWHLQFTGPRKETFLDAISCDSEKNCLVLGDPVDGKFLLMSTEDGEHWNKLPSDKMPDALPNEGAFAASNSSLCVDDHNIYFGTGGAAKARVFHSADSGKTWTVEDTPIASGNASSGIFSLSCKGSRVLHAVGGDYNDPSRVFHCVATFYDGVYIPDKPRGWQLSKQQPGGFRSGVADVDGAAAVAVGPNGEDITQDFGATWEHTDSINLNAVAILDTSNGWAVGPKGTIARFLNKRQYNVRNVTPADELEARGVQFGLLDVVGLSTLRRLLQSDPRRVPDRACRREGQAPPLQSLAAWLQGEGEVSNGISPE
jgi:photosystem II stability/assembly factor-like uncharacterized protein